VKEVKKISKSNPQADSNAAKNEDAGGVQIQKGEFRISAGPLPAPEVLEQYNRIIPDAADRILRMAETQSLRRRAIERDGLQASIQLARRGQAFAVLLSFIGIGGAALCAYWGQPIPASIIGGSTIVGLASLFLRDKKE
jgi:uncharacterized membrane protein